jgi:membrane protein
MFSSSPRAAAGAAGWLAETLETLRRWPWFETLRTLRARFREDRLGLTAGSLTFTTLIALVPLVTVMLAVFSAFPLFAQFQVSLQKYFLQSLVPDAIATPVLRALTVFAGKASHLGSAGFALLVATALALVLTIDRTLNTIWRVRQRRPFAQRLLIYWTALTLGPLALGVSLWLTSYAISASRGLVAAMPGGLAMLLDVLEFALLASAAAAVYHYVPYTTVRWRHAWAGALFVAVGFEVAKKLLAWYVGSVPAVSMIYGAFATVPILLLWIYLVWVVVLLGAVIAAYAPSLQMGLTRRRDAVPGWRFELALAALRALHEARLSAGSAPGAAVAAPTGGGLALDVLALRLRVDPLQLEPLMELLARLNWVGRLDEAGSPRWVLLCEPAATMIGPLVDQTLLAPAATTAALRQHAGFERLSLAEALALR